MLCLRCLWHPLSDNSTHWLHSGIFDNGRHYASRKTVLALQLNGKHVRLSYPHLPIDSRFRSGSFCWLIDYKMLLKSEPFQFPQLEITGLVMNNNAMLVYMWWRVYLDVRYIHVLLYIHIILYCRQCDTCHQWIRSHDTIQITYSWAER